MAEPSGWRLRTRCLTLDRPLLVGVVNVTPDSFSDGGRFLEAEAAISHGRRLVAAGADMLDVGGESTRPGSQGVDAATELSRVLPVVDGLVGAGAVVSVDTSKAAVAERVLSAGAEVINDVTSGADPDMFALVADTGAGLVLMHMRGTPRTMQDDPRYDDVVAEVTDYLVARADAARAAGVSRDRIVIDPGIGFGKTVEHNLELLRRLGELAATGYPVMVGTSRKGFLGRVVGLEDPSDRDVATAATTVLAVAAGAALVRVHDVAASAQAAAIAWAVARAET